MKKIWYVAWREFRHTVLTKAFFFGAIIAPLVFGALAIAASIFLKPEPKPLVGRIAVVSPHDELLEPMAEALVPDNDNGSALPDITGLSAGEAVEVIIDEVSAGTVVPKTIDVEVVAVPESEIDAIKAGIRDGTWTALVVVKPSAIDVDGEARDNRVSLFVSPDSPRGSTRNW
jgi:ABC-type Na+ efflux pump permease subunit